MRRSICYSEPSLTQAGEENTWKFIYTSGSSLPKGTRLRFDICSKGRDIDWEVPSINLKKNDNVIYAYMENGKILQAKEVTVPESFTPQYEFILPSELSSSSEFTIVMGAKEGTKKSKGNRSQNNAQRRRFFLLYIDTTGKGNSFEEPETFSMDIRGNALSNIRVLTPSYVVKNKRFDVIVRFEDEYGNLTNNAPDDTLIELSYENLRENLNWKLFVPETGFITLPNLYFNEEGVYTIKLLNTKSKKVYRSSPIKCFTDNDKHLYWGLLHGEFERVDSTENIENCLRHVRDEKALNFFSTSPFESAEETSADMWKHISQNVTDFDEDDRFTTALGFQWAGVPGEEGVRQIIYCKDGKQILRKKDAKSNTLKKIYKSFAPHDIISIPSFTMANGFHYNFEAFEPEFERVVEIYNAWGSSECTAKEGNPRPIKAPGKSGIQENPKGSIQQALLKNHRFGFVAGGLDDRGPYADCFESDQEQYSPGLTAVITKGHSRQAITEALFNRSCYATTGERIIIGFYIAGFPMGSEIGTAEKQGFLVNRHISGFVAGTTNLKKIEIIRNGKVIHTFKPEGYSTNLEYDDMTPMEKVALPGGNKKTPFVYYYLRVTQEDGHMAWSSPIWIDIQPKSPKIDKKPKKVVVEEEEEEYEEEDEDDDYAAPDEDFDDDEDEE